MLKIENFEVIGWEHAIRCVRNLMNSLDKSDSGICKGGDNGIRCINCASFNCGHEYDHTYKIGLEDYGLMMKLRNAGTDHRGFMRMITVYLDITAPLYWWKEFDTYIMGAVATSGFTKNQLLDKKFEMEDFSHEHLVERIETELEQTNTIVNLRNMIEALNVCQKAYLKSHDNKIWYSMIQLLPSSYNQRRTVMLNYEVLAYIYKSHRMQCYIARNNKLDEWITLCDWIEKLPHSVIITLDTER